MKRAIDDYGDQGRGDVADLLARFQKIDGAKAETLRRELHKASGEMLPYRLAPLGEGFREPTDEEKIAAAPRTPFGSAQGADRWAAGNMADALLGKGDYADAITHFRSEIGRNRTEAMPYLAAVHEIMGEKNPAQAASFATQMQKAGLAAEPEKKPEGTTPNPVPIPSSPTSTPAPIPEPSTPQPQPEPKPETTTPVPTQEPMAPIPSLELTRPPELPRHTQTADGGQSSSDERFDQFTKGTFRREGGYSNDPNDFGGETNHGVTHDTLKKYQDKHGGLGEGGKRVDVKELTQDQAKAIYKQVYYDDRRIREIKDVATAGHIFDLGLNHAPETGATFVQKAINGAIPGANLQVDGVVGSKTIDALNKATPEQLKAINNAIVREREAHYRQQVQQNPKQERFLKGWLKRSGEFRQ